MRSKLHHAKKAVSFGLTLKATIGMSLATLALFGVTVPEFGIEPTIAGQGVAATVGGILGAVLALKG
ncbi:hypothetical protein SmB9_23900 [Sphingosinicella microcystinivorans]|uniref:Uncharacterized protein n=1 Tax=Sphingosinicella microcystinivorans TaxID=335406 RepID=A0AAD1D6F1_SPHMI|nr:hypothetical protein DFR51_1317 [Sphingosinicella microcystinivorans]BBE34732.1 hypothetical protein SmB9_23900 [Sphingosinicella microcystinivorans]